MPVTPEGKYSTPADVPLQSATALVPAPRSTPVAPVAPVQDPGSGNVQLPTPVVDGVPAGQAPARPAGGAIAQVAAAGPALAHVVPIRPDPSPQERARQDVRQGLRQSAAAAEQWARFAEGFDGDLEILGFLTRLRPRDPDTARAMVQFAQWACGVPEDAPAPTPAYSPLPSPAASAAPSAAPSPLRSPAQALSPALSPASASIASPSAVSPLLPRSDPAPGGADALLVPPPRPLNVEQVRALCQLIEQRLPAFVRQHQGLRLVGVLRALAEAGVTAERLGMALRWALVRDHLCQLVTSISGYSASFMTYNTLMRHLWGQDDAAATLPVTALTVGSMTMQRLLRMGEMVPGWTRTVEPDALGQPVPHILTPAGFRTVMSQYWGFLPSLAYAAYALDEPREQLLALRNYGFLATGVVAAHRMMGFQRDFPWLDAGTPRARAAMLQSIDDLCSWQRSFADLGTYLLLRPLAGLAGLAGLDLLQYAEPTPRPVAPPPAGAQADGAAARPGAQVDGKSVRRRHGDAPRPAQWVDEDEPAPQALDIPPRRPAALCEQLSQSIYRAATFGVPMLVFTFTKQLGAALGLPRHVVSTLHYSVLVPGWGLAMAKGERLVAEDPTIQQENTARAARQQAVRARRHFDGAAPGPAPAPPGGAL